MINRLMEKKRPEEGFTLIELLIVVIILGILAAVVVFGVSTFRSDSVKNACNTDEKSVETAAQAFKAKTGAAPTEMTDLTGGADPYLKSSPNTTKGSTTHDYWIDTTSLTSPVGKIIDTETPC